ncbi:MAG: DnaJ domain-containing protein [Bradyrhizobium sp.]
MKTLYDLLEALPDDDAEGLRAAFRKAAKANHPDFNPSDPEASERFRRIVRANAILSDEHQREAYDRLLEIARRQQNPEPKRFSGTIRRLAADAIMSAAVAAVLVGGYLAFKPVDGRSIAQANEAPGLEPMQASATAEISVPLGRTGQPGQLAAAGAGVKFEAKLPDAEAPAAPGGNAAAATTGMASASPVASPARDVETKDVNYYRERGMSAYRAGDLVIALANFDLAIDMDPSLSDSYINRGIVFHRMGDLKRALSDVAEAKRIENRHNATSQARAP